MARVKMDLVNRAKIFQPFDAVKGLREALAVKEFEHDKKSKKEMQAEEIEKICKTILSLKKGDTVFAEYFLDGYINKIKGKAKIDFENKKIFIEEVFVSFDDILSLKKLD